MRIGQRSRTHPIVNLRDNTMSSRTSLESKTSTLIECDNLLNAITAVAKLEHGGELAAKDHDALEKTMEFLDQVEEGYRWIDNPDMKKESRLYAKSLHTAVSSWIPNNGGGEFIGDIERMKGILRDIFEKEEHVDGAEELRSFLNRVLDSNFSSLEEKQSKSIEGDSNAIWNTKIDS